ncbi:hypothetical protein PSI23_11185 [Xenorhabdus sp. XENO-10]|uniref:Uncharacterized protein n=1 Tax=Xenorhabdus yunnanensis TaxID=3025878 RepID=A0ABT5LFG8_9GAMM|nr:hypothetical protein [Xenorhabdus yunnanensis]MDC9589847.1 hypothetical protein [Xenorhabdus yunnanensis]
MIQLKDSESLSVRVTDCATNKKEINNTQSYQSNYNGKVYQPPVTYQGRTKGDPIYR